jgi:hypothetical protein
MSATEIVQATTGCVTSPAELALSTLFRKDASGLYMLALLLTADRSMAESCFVPGLDDAYVDGNKAFGDWVHVWARRIVIRSAIRLVRERQGTEERVAKRPRVTERVGPPAIEKILSLGDLERCVYVLSVLEGYPDRDCASFLGVSLTQIHEIRIRVLHDGSTDEAALCH